MRIRAATGKDAVAVAALWTRAYVDEGGGGRDLPYSTADFEAIEEAGRVLVAEREKAVVGVVALLASGAPGRAVARDGEAELSRLAVAPPARRLGIGRTLMSHCSDIAAPEGWQAIALWSRAYQAAAHRLYELLGYRRQPARDTTDETGHARLVFRLVL